MKFNVYIGRQWPVDKKIVDTVDTAYSADRKAMRLNEEFNRNLDYDHYAYFEPEGGWPAGDSPSRMRKEGLI